MDSQSGNRINIDALRMIPYATLLRAMVSCFMLISIGTACLNAANRVEQGNDIFISVCLIGILAILSYVLAIYCLCGLQDLSVEFRMTLILLVIEAIICSMGILIRAEGIYQRAYGHQQAAMAIELGNNLVYIFEQIVHVIALFVLMKGLAGVLNKTGSSVKLARQVKLIGAIYIVSVVMLHIVISIAYTKEARIGTYSLLISLIIWTLLETVIFFMQRRATILIWQDQYNRSLVSQGVPWKGRW